MKQRARLLLLVAGLALQAGGARALAQELYVIAHSELGIVPGQVRDVFLGEKEFADSVKLVPVENAAAHQLFLDKVMGLTAVGYSGAWTRKAFRDGLNRPPVRRGDAEVIDFVRQTPGAIGYVTRAPEGMAVIGRF